MSFTHNDQAKIDAVTSALLPKHKQWLEEFAECVDRSYDSFIADLQDCLENGYAMHTGDSDLDVPDELWEHYEALYGPVPEEAKAGFWFSCAC